MTVKGLNSQGRREWENRQWQKRNVSRMWKDRKWMYKWSGTEVPALPISPGLGGGKSSEASSSTRTLQSFKTSGYRLLLKSGVQNCRGDRKTLRISSPAFLLQKEKFLWTWVRRPWTGGCQTEEGERVGPLTYTSRHTDKETLPPLSPLSSQSGLPSRSILTSFPSGRFTVFSLKKRKTSLRAKKKKKPYRYWYFGIFQWNRQVIAHCPHSEARQGIQSNSDIKHWVHY